MNTNEINTTIIEHVTLARFRRRFRASIEEWVRGWVINLLQNNIIASVDASTGTPTVTPTYDPNTGKLTFVFTGLKGTDGDPGTGVAIKPSAADCEEIGDAYIDQTNGHLMILTTPPSTFTDGGLIQGPAGDGLNFNWNGTSLGIKNASDSSYSPSNYVDLKGADGSKWHTTNDNTYLIRTDSTPCITTLVESCKVGDYCLNDYNDNVYECTGVVITTENNATTTTSTWLYKCNIKGAQGAGLQFRWVTQNNKEYLEVKKTTDSSWSRSANLKGTDGLPGAPGSIVSKAYRFQPDVAGNSVIFGGGEWWSTGKQAFADARVTINQEAKLANVHLTIITELAMLTDWDAVMGNLNAYENGCSWIGILDPARSYIGETKVNEVYLPDNPNLASIGAWYGSIIIRHPNKWVAGQQIKETGPVLIDLHGVFSDSVKFEKLFVDGMQYHLCMT